MEKIYYPLLSEFFRKRPPPPVNKRSIWKDISL